VRDHHELLSMGHRIESGNAAINIELAQQGATIAQVLRGIHVRLTPPAPPILPIERTLTQVLTCVRRSCVKLFWLLGYQRWSSECAPQPAGNT
jgi:hypothetical protein